MMRVFQSLCLTVLLLSGSLSPAAHAEQPQRKEFSPGIHYTAIGHKNSSERENAPAASEDTGEPVAEAPSEHDRIWNRYKALAAGQNPDENDQDEQQALNQDALPKKPVKPQKAAPPTAPEPHAQTHIQPRLRQQMDTKAATDETLPKSAGLAGIIEEYRRNKDQRREMKHLRISQPEAPVPPESKMPLSPAPAKAKAPQKPESLDRAEKN